MVFQNGNYLDIVPTNALETMVPMEDCRTYADSMTFETNIHFELHDSQPVIFPSPTLLHHKVAMEIFMQLWQHHRSTEQNYEIFRLPLDVRLFEKEGDRPENVNTVLQPDIIIVCDQSKIDDYSVRGAPELVVEILDNFSRQYDRRFKFDMYQRAGVQEYWIIDPKKQVVLVYQLEDGQYYVPEVYTSKDTVPVGVLEDCTVELTSVFSEA